MIPAGELRDRAIMAPTGNVAVVAAHPQVLLLRHRLTQPLVFLEVLCSPRSEGVDLRHVRDADRPGSELQLLEPGSLGGWAETTSQGAFRPNRSAPSLRSGWRCHATTDAELNEALEQLYPGALADWHAWECGVATPTSFREFVGRQTGMYRVAQEITDAGADAVAEAGCTRELCLRRRCWDTPRGGPAPAAEPDVHGLTIPCLEPCALVLDLARWMAKEQGTPQLDIALTSGELESLERAIRIALEHPPGDLREGSTRHPVNPRRLHLLATRLRDLGSRSEDGPLNKGT